MSRIRTPQFARRSVRDAATHAPKPPCGRRHIAGGRGVDRRSEPKQEARHQRERDREEQHAPSSEAWSSRRMPCGAAATKNAQHTKPVHSPQGAPIDASTRLSVSTCRARRQRPAPIAARTLHSWRRLAERASSRFARFAEAISRTTSTAAKSVHEARRMSPICRSRSGRTTRRSSLRNSVGHRGAPPQPVAAGLRAPVPH